MPLLSAAVALCEDFEARIAPEPLRILIAEPSCAGLLRSLAPLVRQGRARLTVIGTDARRVNQAAARRGPVEGIVFEAIDGDADHEAVAQFDVALTFAFGPIFNGDPALGRALARRLAPGGLLCVFQPPDSISFDLLLGATEGWFAGSLDPRYPLGRVSAAQDCARLLVAAGFGAIDSHVLPDDMGTVLLAAADRPAAVIPSTAAPVFVVDRPSDLQERIVRTLRVDGAGVHLLPAEQTAPATADAEFELIFPALFGDEFGLDQAVARLAALLEAVQERKCRLWVVVQGLDSPRGAAIDPRAEALWCFTRVAINEYPGLQIKLVDIADAVARRCRRPALCRSDRRRNRRERIPDRRPWRFGDPAAVGARPRGDRS